MLSSIQLSKAGLTTSRLAFGTSRLHYSGRRDRQRLLASAASLGFVHFDTAPSYGDGLAEAELSWILKGKRDRFVIATKYGVPPDPLLEALPSFGEPLRYIRAAARRVGLWQIPRQPLTPAGLRESERSLRRLQSDWIDILFLHEPRPECVPRPLEILEELLNLRRRGLIRTFGLAGSWDGIDALMAATPDLAQVVQTAEAEWPEALPPDITYGAVAGGIQSYGSQGVSTEQALERLRSALNRRPHGVIVVSTTKIDHLNLLVEAATSSPV